MTFAEWSDRKYGKDQAGSKTAVTEKTDPALTFSEWSNKKYGKASTITGTNPLSLGQGPVSLERAKEIVTRSSGTPSLSVPPLLRRGSGNAYIESPLERVDRELYSGEAAKNGTVGAGMVLAMQNDLKNRAEAIQTADQKLDAMLKAFDGYMNNTASEEYEARRRDYNTALADRNRLYAAYAPREERYHAAVDAYKTNLKSQGPAARGYAAQAEALEDEAEALIRAANALSSARGYGRGAAQRLAERRREAEQKRAEAEVKQQEAARLRSLAEEAESRYYGILPMMDDYSEKSRVTSQGSGDWTYEFINDLMRDNGRMARDMAREMAERSDASRTYGTYTAYTYMTEDEIGVYNYLYATEGKDEADRFLARLMNTLNYRMGAEEYENMSGLEKSLFWIPQGIDQFATGIGQIFSKETLPTSATQYTGSMVQREAGELGAERDESGQVRYDDRGSMIGQSVWGKLAAGAYGLGTIVSNMAPSLLLSYVTGGLLSGAVGSGAMTAATAGNIASATGSLTMGASAAGNAYKMKMDEGWTRKQALNYATLVGVSESTLQYLIGGIDALGGEAALSDKALTKILEQVAKVDNAFARTALNFTARLTVSGVQEGLEEGLQEILEPAFATMITGQEYEVDAGDVAEAFLMGFLTSGIFDAAGAYRAATAPTALTTVRFNSAGIDGYLGADGVDYFDGCIGADEVQARYRELARKNHPDAGGDAAVMAAINRQRDIQEAFYKGRQKAAETAQQAETVVTPEPETVYDAMREQMEGQNNAATESGTAIQDYQRKPRYGEILNMIRAHLPEIQNDAPVAVITGNEFQKTAGDNRTLRKKVIDFFDSIGNKVFRKGMGEITLNEAGAHDSLAHGYGRLKAATFAALPKVLTDGRLISTKGPYEGHNYGSYFIAAPVAVGEEPVYVGALVIKDNNMQRYKLHEVLATNKSGVPLFQSESGKIAGPLRSDTPQESPIDSPISKIPQPGQTVNSGQNTAPQNTVNGGNGNAAGQIAGSQPPVFGGRATGAVPDGGGQRQAGVGTGGQTGGLGGGAEAWGVVARSSQIQAANQRRSAARNLRLEKISSRELGLSQGTDAKAVTVLPESTWDVEMQETARRVRTETGKDVTFVLGGIPIRRSDGSVARARGVNMERGIILQADNTKAGVGQIADHEIYHELAANDPALNEAVKERIAERYSPEEIDRAMEKYIASMNGIIELPENAAPEEIKAFYDAVREELLADAYAGIDAYGARVRDFGDAVNEVTGERWGLRSGQNAAATERTTGPPDRYSISENLEDDLLRVLDGSFNARNNEVYVGESSNFLTGTIGADSLAVTMPANKAYSAMVTKEQAVLDGRYQENMNYHGLGVEGLIRALEASEDPVAAFAAIPEGDNKRTNSIVLVTDEKNNGEYIVVVQAMEAPGELRGKNINTNKVVTAYDRVAITADIERAAIEDRLLHLDKKRSQELLAGQPASNSRGAIRKTDFKKNIQRFWDNVKWEKSGSQIFTAEGQPETETEMGRKLREAMEGWTDREMYSLDDDYIPQSAAEYAQMQQETPQDRPFPEEYNEYAAALNEVLDSYKQKLPRKQEEGEKSALAALEESLESRKASKKYFGYLLLQDNEDYAEKSRYKSTANGKTRNWIDILLDDYSETGFDDPLYDAINGNEDARQALRNQAGARYGSGAGAPGQLRSISAEGERQAKMMTEDEIGLFNYLYATQGKETAYDFYDFLRDDLSSRLRQEKGENDSSDQKQFEEYKKILGENMPNTLADFLDLKYNNAEWWEYTKALKSYLKKYPTSNSHYFDAMRELKDRGIKKGVLLPAVQKTAYILPSGSRDPYHIMRRMMARGITDDQVRGYVAEAKAMFVQWNGQRQFFISDDGMAIMLREKDSDDWIFKTVWGKHDFDEESETILEVLKKHGI